jgi:pyrimidine operon attenuation protein/uracil phosphoribosyltransferase
MERTRAPAWTLYASDALNAPMDRMAAAMAAHVVVGTDPVLVGIRRRGVPIARMLNERLASRFNLGPLPEVELTITRYADDLTLLHPETRLSDDAAARWLDLSGRTAIVVDDVLYHGHSLLRAVEYLRGRAVGEVRTAVLVDRNIARLPIRADVAGLVLEVAPGDVVECHVPPYEPELAVKLWQRGDG